MIPVGILGAAARRSAGPAPGVDPYWDSVVSLLNFDDPDDPWKDEKGVLWTPGGTPTISEEEKRFGTSSLRPGEGWLDASHPSLQLGTDDFTIEAFIKMDAASHWAALLVCGPENDTGVYIQNGDLLFYNAGSRARSGEVGRTLWYHVAVCRASGLLRTFVNGVTEWPDGLTMTKDLYSTSYRIAANKSGGEQFGGIEDNYIDSLRVTKGVARYVGNFTPPSEPFPTSGP